MSTPQIAILGTGLIGTSIGLGLRARPGRKFEVIGSDRDYQNARTAKRLGALDHDTGSVREAVSNASLVIIAAPVQAARELMADMAPHLLRGAVITDVCSTKANVMRWADELLPREVDFVGGHPMAGRETSGPEAADADLFKNATWAITPSPSAREEAVETVIGIVEALGANPIHIDAAEHDQFAAAVSHMPLVLSVALFRLIRRSAGWEDAALLAGPGFRDLTRLASGDPTMSFDIAETNRDAILHWLGRFREELVELEGAIRGGGEPLQDMFAATRASREHWIHNQQHRRLPPGDSLPSTQDTFGELLLGGKLYEKVNAATDRLTGDRKPDENRRN